MRILDLGCGTGTNLAKLGVTESDEVTGVDIDAKVLPIARHRFPRRAFFVGAGEKLPFDNASFDRVISNVALPYMDIPKTLLEIHRVLVPGGQVWLSLHPASFTVREIRNTSSHLLSLVFRLYVLGNGVWFHYTGKTLCFV
jgi:ubiquinone/menaquinone biosynthesis C-methylase UbiE